MPRLSAKRKELLTTMMKEAIFEAATSVLREFGSGGMTMDRVAAASHLAKGSLYLYFQGKDDLLQFIWRRIVEPISKAVEEITAADLPAAEKLRRVLCTMFEHLERHQGVLRILLHDETIRRVRESSEQSGRDHAVEHFTRVFAQGMEDGTFAPGDPAQLARMFFACVSELLESHVVSGSVPDAGQVIEQAMRFFLLGVSARPGQQSGQGHNAASVN